MSSDVDRILELEVKVSFQDKLLADLDDVVRHLRDELDRLRADVAKLHEHVEAGRGHVVDEKPPHW